IQVGWRDAPRLWLVTRGAQSVLPGDQLEISQAPLWGLGRTLALEHPELACTLIDLDPHAPIAADSLTAELANGGPENQLALRDGACLVARLERCEAPPVAPGNTGPVVRGAGTYLITGGLGGLGLTVAEWLVAHGARHLALLGRHAPSASAGAILANLRSAGAEVMPIEADVTQFDQLADALRCIEDQMPPLHGVVHAAGVLDDATMLSLSADRLSTVTAPKAAGAWNLHRLTLNCQLEWFVLFSSMASMLGSPGQANYAAANAFLDSLAHHRATLGLPALSVNWGPWSAVGLAAAAANRGERLALRGISSITPEQGIAGFGRLLGSKATQVGVVAFDVRQWREFYPTTAQSPLLSVLVHEHGAARRVDTTNGSAMRTTLLMMDSNRRRQALQTYLIDIVARVLRLASARVDPRAPLTSLGLDSLMGLEIRNRLEADLGLRLPATLVWTYPTIAAVAVRLAELLEPPPSVESQLESGNDGIDLTRLLEAGVADLSDAEAASLLEAELASMSDVTEGRASG
ncbi:MAG TPA: beta-ketoacyl reductase, partial [Chloroflexota bacterium]